MYLIFRIAQAVAGLSFHINGSVGVFKASSLLGLRIKGWYFWGDFRLIREAGGGLNRKKKV